MPNFLKVEKGATAYLESHADIQHEWPICSGRNGVFNTAISNKLKEQH